MTESQSELLVLSGPKEAITAFHREVAAQPGSESALTERKNFDGNSQTWLAIANVAVLALPHILGFIKDLVTRRQVKKIKIGDVEIENPSAEDIERLRKSIDKSLEARSNSAA
ncbi:hypothetical protein LRH25_09145 [Ideonella azotifigens]|uniref:Uncharacterized protein n=1 Tax=Ideonella azotifigens TaxID=513160 RepID=A0ABN1KFV3_9BURK|nr:hypothetical protein [Ideonella azotifigens]MCD2340508.1 hypothetical protein [Ideonella azotifigens]